MRKRIALVVAMFYEAGKCISSMPCLLLQPVYTFIILMAFFMYWVIVLAYLSTSGMYRSVWHELVILGEMALLGSISVYQAVSQRDGDRTER